MGDSVGGLRSVSEEGEIDDAAAGSGRLAKLGVTFDATAAEGLAVLLAAEVKEEVEEVEDTAFSLGLSALISDETPEVEISADWDLTKVFIVSAEYCCCRSSVKKSCNIVSEYN